MKIRQMTELPITSHEERTMTQTEHCGDRLSLLQHSKSATSRPLTQNSFWRV